MATASGSSASSRIPSFKSTYPCHSDPAVTGEESPPGSFPNYAQPGARFLAESTLGKLQRPFSRDRGITMTVRGSEPHSRTFTTA